MKLPANDPTVVLYANRAPTEKDTNHGSTMWISTEHIPHNVFIGQHGVWAFTGKFYPNAKMPATEQEYESLVRQTYLHSLDAAKDLKPNTPEWELVWSVLDSAKDYYESKKRDEDER